MWFTVDVFVPKIYTDLSTSKILTMEWVDGVRLNDKVRRYNFSPFSFGFYGYLFLGGYSSNGT